MRGVLTGAGVPDLRRLLAVVAVLQHVLPRLDRLWDLQEVDHGHRRNEVGETSGSCGQQALGLKR